MLYKYRTSVFEKKESFNKMKGKSISSNLFCIKIEVAY